MDTKDLFEDLKQYIAEALSQSFSEMATKDDIANMATKEDLANIRSEMATKDDLVEIRQEMHAGFNSLVGQLSELDLKVDTIADAQAETYQDHEQRITRLEKRTA